MGIWQKALAVCAALAVSQPAAAQGLIRDAEIEGTLKLLLDPILRAAGSNGSRIQLFIANDPRMNAFVGGGNNMVLTSGLLRRLDTPEMVQAVMAHELAHLNAGHQQARAATMSSGRTAAALGLVLGLAAAAAGGGVGVAAGLAEAHRRAFFSYTRGQESAADQASARYLADAGIDPMNGVKVLDLFRGQELLSTTRQDPYTRTHPLSRDRIARLKAQAAVIKVGPSRQPPNLAYWHARMVAKFDGFVGNPTRMLRRTKKSDTGEIATLTRAVAYHRLPKPKRAVRAAKRLTQMRPKDPYYHELLGQIHLESGNAKAALPSYRRAASLAPKEPLILAGLGHALLNVNSSASNAEALRVLRAAYARDPLDGALLRNLATAFARAGNPGWASVVTAERYALYSNFRQAEIHAKRALALVPQGSVGWHKADDILAAARVFNARKKRR